MITLAASTMASAVDNATPPEAPTVTHQQIMDIPHAIASNLQAKSYPGGHMPFLDKIARKQLISYLRIFYKGALMNWSSAK